MLVELLLMLSKSLLDKEAKVPGSVTSTSAE